MSSVLRVIRVGVVGYEEATRIQTAIASARAAGEVPDTLLVLEHPPVYTRGRRTTADELPMGEDWYRMQGIEIVDTDRGGRLTYHGPGQLVIYPIMHLGGLSVPEFISKMEAAMIAALADYGVDARLFEGLTGVWVGDEPPPAGDARKIGSIGLHIHKQISTHGLAINVNNDLQPFEWAVPCGIEACRMTSLSRELGAEQDFHAFATTVVARLAAAYDRQPVEASLSLV